MRLVAVNRLEPGMVLDRDVVTGRPGAVPLLRRGTRICAAYPQRLREAGIHAVWIDDAFGEGIAVDDALSPETRMRAEELTAETFDEARAAVARGRGISDRALTTVQDVAGRIANEVAVCAPAALALQDLAAASAYTHRHSMQVTVIGLLIARAHFQRVGWVDARGRRRYDDLDARLAKIGFGLLIHDIGKLAVPEEILNKPGRLSEEEFAVVKGHPMAGVGLLPAAAISPLATAVVRSHHERWSGGGYPDGRAGKDIHVFARIAAAADVFDAVTSQRPYRGAAPPHVGVRIIRDGAGRDFDPEVVESFNRVVMPFPPGHHLTLPDGREAVVARVDEHDPDRPTVRLRSGDGFDEERIDLTELLRPSVAAA